jgi:hypothetical protein
VSATRLAELRAAVGAAPLAVDGGAVVVGADNIVDARQVMDGRSPHPTYPGDIESARVVRMADGAVLSVRRPRRADAPGLTMLS